MDANTLLVLIVGMVLGGGIGYVTAWRLARKLEHHDVVLAKWDQPFDAQAPRPAANVFQIDRQSQR